APPPPPGGRPAVPPPPPADERPEQVAERPRERDGDVAPEGRVDRVPEEDDVAARNGTARHGSAVDHHQLARRGKDRVDGHQPEDGVEPVVADEGGDAVRDGGEQHGRRRVYSATVKTLARRRRELPPLLLARVVLGPCQRRGPARPTVLA